MMTTAEVMAPEESLRTLSRALFGAALACAWVALWAVALALAAEQEFQPQMEGVSIALQWLMVLALFGLFGGGVRELMLWTAMPWQQHLGYVMGSIVSCWVASVPVLLRYPAIPIIAMVAASVAGFGGTFLADRALQRLPVPLAPPRKDQLL